MTADSPAGDFVAWRGVVRSVAAGADFFGACFNADARRSFFCASDNAGWAEADGAGPVAGGATGDVICGTAEGAGAAAIVGGAGAGTVPAFDVAAEIEPSDVLSEVRKTYAATPSPAAATTLAITDKNVDFRPPSSAA